MLGGKYCNSQVLSLLVQCSYYSGGSPKNGCYKWKLVCSIRQTLSLGIVFILLHLTMQSYEKWSDRQSCPDISMTPPARFNRTSDNPKWRQKTARNKPCAINFAINCAITFFLPFAPSKIKYGSTKAVQNFPWRTTSKACCRIYLLWV